MSILITCVQYTAQIVNSRTLQLAEKSVPLFTNIVMSRGSTLYQYYYTNYAHS